MSLNEIWKPIKGYEGLYEVSNFGRVRSKKGILKFYKEKSGYLTICLCKYKKQTKTIHRLVAETFIPNPKKYKCINHKDENKANNCVENLEWCSYKYNNSYNDKLDKLIISKYKKINQYDLDGNYIKTWNSIKEASEKLKISQKSISNCICRRSKKAGEFMWEKVGE